jgi:hypothetical protein
LSAAQEKGNNLLVAATHDPACIIDDKGLIEHCTIFRQNPDIAPEINDSPTSFGTLATKVAALDSY